MLPRSELLVFSSLVSVSEPPVSGLRREEVAEFARLSILLFTNSFTKYKRIKEETRYATKVQMAAISYVLEKGFSN